MREGFKKDVFILHLFLRAFGFAVLFVFGALGGPGAYIGEKDKTDGNQRYQYHHPYVVSSLHQDRFQWTGVHLLDEVIYNLLQVGKKLLLDI
jgi:hypothetical protein